MSSQRCIGVIGGMGPLASAEFVRTVYDYAVDGPEQQAPALFLWSDPSVPDRTAALLDRRADVLERFLKNAVERCCALGADDVVICCVTMHAVVPWLPAALQARITSLVDVLLSAAIEQALPLLLLTSTGTRTLGVLECHPLWPGASRWLRWPDAADQRRVHDAIYDIKRNRGIADAIALIAALLQRYGVRSFAAGCTELHLVHRQWESCPAGCVDPLDIVARRIAASPIRREPSKAGAR
jgi:aspartate racemase